MGRDSLSAADLELHELAREQVGKAAAGYTGFPVGAAVRVADGEIFLGVNVENASYSLTNCAERTAIFSAAAAGHRRVEVVAVAGDANTLPPCGACRQVIAEFGYPSARVIFPEAGELVSMTIGDLLPVSFEPHGRR